MKETELNNLRGLKEKHFLQTDGTIIAHMYNENIHFKKNGKYEEIDNTLIKENDYYINKNNDYKVKFGETNEKFIMQIEKDNNYINFNLENSNSSKIIIDENNSKLVKNLKYENILDNIDLHYKIRPTMVKENIIINKSIETLNKLKFKVKTNLYLSIEKNNIIIAKKDEDIIFKLEAPYIIDAKENINKKIIYSLTKLEDEYELSLNMDESWLKEAVYPIVIDPTITTNNQTNGVYDTYIYPGDTNVDRNSQDMLKVGVEKINGIDIVNRSLIKFDLPTIGTGSQIVNAELNLEGYFYNQDTYNGSIINIHNITNDWTEETANWNYMNDKYNSKIEASFVDNRNGVIYNNSAFSITSSWINRANITNLVRKWYSNTPNYGIMLKLNDEIYINDDIPTFFSKNNNISNYNPKPILAITYRNQNGLENYMNYISQKYSKGSVYENTYNGNLTAIFNLSSITDSKFPVDLNLIYNTNDVILQNDLGYGAGYRMNFQQTISEEIIDNVLNLKYTDEDGTIHYFRQKNSSFVGGNNVIQDGNISDEIIYLDEDGLNLTIKRTSIEYIMTDKYNNESKFTIRNSIGYLTQLKDCNNNIINILYNSDNTISKITDNNNEINLLYQNDRIEISSSNETIYICYLNNKISNIISPEGSISIHYNENGIISSITDINGLKYIYNYYEEIPYRVKKVLEYGLNDTLGQSFELLYGFDSTTIIDNKNRIQTLTYNSYGNLVSRNYFKNLNNVKDSYGTSMTYGEGILTAYGENTQNKNKLLKNSLPIKYVKNYLKNSSFEQNNIFFLASQNANLYITNETARTCQNSLKILNNANGEYIYQSLSIPKGKDYTFSAYIKNNNKLKLSLSYLDSDNNIVEKFETINELNDNFSRYDVSIYYPDNATSNLNIKIYFEEIGITYIDDVQLEEGYVANSYNLVENSDFSDGINDWIINSNGFNLINVITLDDGSNALKISMNPKGISSLTKQFNINGHEGDTFRISFWYKDEGYVGETGYGSSIINDVAILFNYIDTSSGIGYFPNRAFNPNENSWQYFSHDFTAAKDYDSITLRFSQRFNANDLYLTNICVFKDQKSVTYNYDENGNITLIRDLNNRKTEYNYNSNNQLTKMLDSNEKNYYYEYNSKNNLLKAMNPSGLNHNFSYDLFGNIITNKISKGSIEPKNGLFKIRINGNNKYISYNNSSIECIDEHDYCIWNLEKTESYYKINHSVLKNKFFSEDNNTLKISNFNQNKSLFELIKCENGSYLIKLKNTEKYLKYNNGTFIFESYIQDDYSFQFYFENKENCFFIENNTYYTENGKYIKTITDSNLNQTNYQTDNATGLLKKITNSKNQSINYNYNANKELISVTNNQKSVEFEYNNYKKLSKIIHGRKEYNFIYDEFLNNKSIKLGDNILCNYTYETNNGNLIATEYGNQQVIQLSYDDFNRVNQLIKIDDTYNYFYDDNSDLTKIESNNNIKKYKFDLLKRLAQYKFNNFLINYIYDNNDNIIETKYNYNSINKKINYVFNLNNNIINTDFDNNQVGYQYDYLGRLTTKNLKNLFNIEYKYISNGDRTTLLINEINNNGNIYYYKYDKLNNITHIYNNNKLINKYYYDNYNQLIKEKDYINNKIIKYNYDNLGNILSKISYDLHNYNQLDKKIYKYDQNETEDQLINYNGDSIVYDSIGNPTQIGNTTLEWINGRELNRYQDSENNITYKYNENGIRISKKVNSKETFYFTENNKIILEITNNDMLYFIRDDVDDLLAFEYNGILYYYLKNNNNDIIGIMDQNCNIVANYTYDSWGKILSITDNMGNDVSLNPNHIANINPFRYRSYYYDIESKLYYLNSRYYNPEWGRFLNIDSVIGISNDIIGYNFYAYTNNNPILNVDYTGQGFVSNVFNKVRSVFASKNTKTTSASNSIKSANNSSKINSLISTTTTQTIRSKVMEVKTNTNVNKLPTLGEPNSSSSKPNGDYRDYGPDGRAKTDTDYSHPEHHPDLPNPHAHDWSWDENGVPHRGPAYDPNVGNIIGIAAAAGFAYLTYRGIRLLPSLVPGFWWTLPANLVTP